MTDISLGLCPSATLPAELWWLVVDMLLARPRRRYATDHGVLDATKLGMTCSALASVILGDREAWASRCRRDFGSARVELHAEHARFGISWLCLYATMCIRASLYKGKPRRRCGVVSRHPTYICAVFDTSMHGLYEFSATRSCPKNDALVVVECGPHPDRPGAEWLSMRRMPYRHFPHFVLRPTEIGRDAFCACKDCCRFGVRCLSVRARMATYNGGWSHGLPDGHGCATFTNGLVYDGHWSDGLPHGLGTLDGVARESVQGVFVAHKRLCGCFIDGEDQCPCDGTTGGAWCYDGQVALYPDTDHGLDLSSPQGNSMYKWWSVLLSTEPNNLDGYQHGNGTRRLCTRANPKTLPHGQGTATHRDGRVFVGTWRRGLRAYGRYTMPDGAVFKGVFYGAMGHVGIGRTRWPSGASTRCMSWGNDEQPHAPEDAFFSLDVASNRFHITSGGMLRDCADRIHASPRRSHRQKRPHTNPLCVCDPWDSARACPPAVRQATILMHNGDLCVMQWGPEEGDLQEIRSFRFSPDCADPAFAGSFIDNCTWVCVAVPRARARRPYCPDDYVYWPSDDAPDASASFGSYVRRRLIGWDTKAVAFWEAAQVARRFVIAALRRWV
nr:phosphatidylinositol phosphate kinase motif-containing protein [Pandoravirus massiliensis]